MIENLGHHTISGVASFGRAVLFFVIGVLNIFVRPFQFYKIIDHTWFIGVKSIFVIMLTALFTGLVLGLQGYYSLVKFGSEAALGSAVAISLMRELGPVFTAIMIAARAGSAMAAEMGVMRISEQIDALKTMHINPVRFLFTPRIVAAVISFPILTALFDVVGYFRRIHFRSLMLGINRHVYMSTVVSSIYTQDILGGFYKSLVFSLSSPPSAVTGDITRIFTAGSAPGA